MERCRCGRRRSTARRSSSRAGFREARGALLLGTASFWEGVDFPGEALEVLIVTRPAVRGCRPIRWSRRAARRIDELGESSFARAMVPEAVLRFRQGVGRLVRRRSDRGVLAILDPRIVNKGYGAHFRRGLPVALRTASNLNALTGEAKASSGDHGMIELDGATLTLSSLERVARGFEEVRLAPSVAARLARSRDVIDRALAAKQPVYGSTPASASSRTATSRKRISRGCSLNLLRSHAAGVGPALSEAETRALGLLRANSLAVGVSGVRQELVERRARAAQPEGAPGRPEQGSVGASGDLAPLAHFALVLVGEGRATFERRVMSGAKPLDWAGLRRSPWPRRKGSP
jgi:hypothetical protein